MNKKFRLTYVSLLIAVIMTALLIVDNLGLDYQVSAFQLTDLPGSMLQEKERYAELDKTCLLLWDSQQPESAIYVKHMGKVLQELRVPYDLKDMASDAIPAYDNYRTVVIGFYNFELYGEQIMKLCSWVEQGGACMLGMIPEYSPIFMYMAPYIGIVEGGKTYQDLEGLVVKNGFMIGGDGFSLHWDGPGPSALSLRLAPSASVYVESDDEYHAPMIWSIPCGQGKWVVNNHNMNEKGTRGMTACAYMLLEEIGVYPVINASTFFIDDFPSPVPSGTADYIRRDYQRDISSFYSSVWWPDMLKLCKDYGVRYTGVIIEDYNDVTSGALPVQTERERFDYFGSMLLNEGGEIGLHGYNHQPLCFPGFDFKGTVDYNLWESVNTAADGIREVLGFTDNLFPDNHVAVYVPPSNILSAEGRTLLRDHFPQIRVLASLYLEGEVAYSQDFQWSDDGMIEFPRVISGAVLNNYTRWVALNALNLYYVNSHFMHPDDVLDEDRGAAMGWKVLYQNLSDYVDWLYSSAPNIRSMVATDAGRATTRYDVISYERQDTEDSVHLRLHGFWDEAQLMMRSNGRRPVKVIGGTLDQVEGNFFLISAKQEQITIVLEG